MKINNTLTYMEPGAPTRGAFLGRVLLIIAVCTCSFLHSVAGDAVSPRGFKAAIAHESKEMPSKAPHAASSSDQAIPQSCSAPAVPDSSSLNSQPIPSNTLLFVACGAFLIGIAVGFLWNKIFARYLKPPAVLRHAESSATSTPFENGQEADTEREHVALTNKTTARLLEEEENQTQSLYQNGRAPMPEAPPTPSTNLLSGTSTLNKLIATEDQEVTILSSPDTLLTTRTTTQQQQTLVQATSAATASDILNVSASGLPGSSTSLAETIAQILSSMDERQMTTKEKLEFCNLLVHVDHTQHMRWLGAQANQLRSEQRDIAAHSAAHMVAKDAAIVARERTEDFRRMCSDSMATGIALMATLAAHQAWKRGIFRPLSSRCGNIFVTNMYLARIGGQFGLWVGFLQKFQIAWCYVSALSDGLLGLAVLLTAPWAVYRSNLLSDYHSMPVTKLLVGLGIGCGAAGHIAIGRLGGDSLTWFILWEIWTVLHVILSTMAHNMCHKEIQTILNRPGASSADLFHKMTGGSGDTAKMTTWITALMWIGLGIVLPSLMAVLPFGNSTYSTRYNYSSQNEYTKVLLLTVIVSVVVGGLLLTRTRTQQRLGTTSSRHIVR